MFLTNFVRQTLKQSIQKIRKKFLKLNITVKFFCNLFPSFTFISKVIKNISFWNMSDLIRLALFSSRHLNPRNLTYLFKSSVSMSICFFFAQSTFSQISKLPFCSLEACYEGDDKLRYLSF